jgi:hypothetical protein
MVQVLTGPIESFDMLLYPDQAAQNQWYLQNQLSQINATLSDVGQKFMQGATDLYNRIHDTELVRRAKAAIRMAQSSFHPNQIRSLETLEDLQAASLVMQRWVMAQPDLRAIYQKHLVEGYSDTYTDIQPGAIGETHYDYRRVMDGVIRDEEDGWVSRQYIEDLLKGDRDLDFDEQVDILKTWQIIEMYAKARKADPTNPFGGDMG